MFGEFRISLEFYEYFRNGGIVSTITICYFNKIN